MDDKIPFLQIPQYDSPQSEELTPATPIQGRSAFERDAMDAMDTIGVEFLEPDSAHPEHSQYATEIDRIASNVDWHRNQIRTSNNSHEKPTSIVGSIVRKVTPGAQKSRELSTRDFIKMESKLGGQLFGPVAEGDRREFFCLDEHTWVWYESTTSPETDEVSSLTTRYEIRGDRIIKMQDGQPYRYASLGEAQNLLRAANGYYSLITSQTYNNQAA